MMASKSWFSGVCAAAAITLVFGAAQMGCGSDDEGGSDGKDASADTGGSSGTGGTGGTGGTTGGTGGMDSGIMSCDTTVVSATTCGTETCPAVNATLARFTCQVNCCVNDQCGQRFASTDPTRATQCALAAQPDTRCEDFTVTGTFMGNQTYTGCCTDTNQCGGILSFVGICIAREDAALMGGTGIPPARACDAPATDSGT